MFYVRVEGDWAQSRRGSLFTLLLSACMCDTEVWDAVRTRGGSSCKYITCISFAAPHVGGEGYQVAHDLLLDEKRLKHLCVTTDRDFVPVGVPLISPGLRQNHSCIGLFGWMPRLEILGLISTTYPIIWLLAYSLVVLASSSFFLFRCWRGCFSNLGINMSASLIRYVLAFSRPGKQSSY